MSMPAHVILADTENSEREILHRVDRRLERLDEWIHESANPALVELRAEVEMTRISYEHQFALTRGVVERYLATADRLDRTLDENTRTLRALHDALTGDANGPGAPA
jgi:hypothetical protein